MGSLIIVIVIYYNYVLSIDEIYKTHLIIIIFLWSDIVNMNGFLLQSVSKVVTLYHHVTIDKLVRS